MKVIQVHPEAPPKPAVGTPCNGCGVCCLVEPCPLGVLWSRSRRGPCKALRWSSPAGRYRCGALPDSGLGPQPLWRRLWHRCVARWIAAGQGCDAHLEVVGSTV